MILIADKKKICPPMICAQRLLRRARATDEEEMMEIHLEKSNGEKKNLPLIQAIQWILTVESCRVFLKSGQFLFLHLFVKKTMMSLKSLFCK